MLSLKAKVTHCYAEVSWDVKRDSPEDLKARLRDKLSETLVHSKVWRPVLHDEPSLSHMQRMQSQVNGCSQEKLLSQGDLLELFELLRESRLG